MDHSLLAIIARFPDRARAIKELAAVDEGFYSLCTDLGDAEAALSGWERSQAPVRDERCHEYRELVAALADEVRAALESRG